MPPPAGAGPACAEHENAYAEPEPRVREAGRDAHPVAVRGWWSARLLCAAGAERGERGRVGPHRIRRKESWTP